ncbi:MAG: hypothetical protein ACRDD8_10500 [Bacteroidales bacterium]
MDNKCKMSRLNPEQKERARITYLSFLYKMYHAKLFNYRYAYMIKKDALHVFINDKSMRRDVNDAYFKYKYLKDNANALDNELSTSCDRFIGDDGNYYLTNLV